MKAFRVIPALSFETRRSHPFHKVLLQTQEHNDDRYQRKHRAYEYAKEKKLPDADVLKQAAEVQVESFLHRIDHKIEVDHHDMGFLYSPSCVAAYKLTGSEKGKEAAIKAADQLITRYHPVGEFIHLLADVPDNTAPHF